MTSILVALHVITAILFLGPVTVAVSTFHTKALAAHSGDANALGAAQNLHKITKSYGTLSLIVPLLGVAVFLSNSHFMKEGGFHASIALAVIAWAVLFFLILPRQRKMLAALGGLDESEDVTAAAQIEDWNKAKGQLSMFGGIFSLLWVVIAILMFV